MDTDNNVKNNMADEENVQVAAEVSGEQSGSQANGDVVETSEPSVTEPVAAEEAQPTENIEGEQQPGAEVPTLEVSAETPTETTPTSPAGGEQTTEQKPEEAAEVKEDDAAAAEALAGEGGEQPPGEGAEEGGGAVDGETTENVNEESTEVVQSEEAMLGNDQVAIHVETNDEEPEKEQGPLVEASAQPLSREGSPVPDGAPSVIVERPDASTTPPPVLLEGALIDDNALEGARTFTPSVMDDTASIASSVEVPVYNRAELIERYQQAVEERSGLQSLNSQLQHRLAEYFRKKKTDERQQEIEKNTSDQEQRYIKYLANLEELQVEQTSEQESYKEQIEELKERCSEKQNRAKEAREEFLKHKYDMAKQALNSRSGRSIPVKDIEQYQGQELKKDNEVTQVRLENIKLKNRLKKREMQLKAKEELAEGLHLIDFEQLKIENQTYNEKIEERNEELLKLRKKITTTVQVLTHLKEKLQFVQAENAEQRTSLKIVDAHVAQKRDVLTRTKQARDALRIDNVKLRQKCGLLGNEPLLRDYEDRKDEDIELY